MAIQAEIFVAGIAALSAMSVALIQRNSAIARDVRETKEQVQNSHGSNLRDDLDDMHETVRSVLMSVEGLRDEVRMERSERKAVSDRLDVHLNECPC